MLRGVGLEVLGREFDSFSAQLEGEGQRETASLAGSAGNSEEPSMNVAN